MSNDPLLADDQLAAELDRRANAVSPRLDWAQRDLLPAVWHQIDARPAPVVTSRWSPLAGLAGLVVALLVLVVAVPRLALAPPSASSSPADTSLPTVEPSPSPGPVSASEFAARLSAGALDGKTVLVNGRIGPNLLYGPICGPFNGAQTRCYLGPLEGVDPPIDVSAAWIATSDADATRVTGLSWDRWHFPQAPVEGLLVLSVTDSSQVEFIGLARESEQDLAWSVVDANALDINSIGVDDVVLVRGWLVDTEPPGTHIEIDCVLLPQFPDLDGLPSRYCQPTDYLSSARPVDRGGPDSAALLPVQRNGAQQFGVRNLDEASLYAIAPRLYGGGCAGAPPCWLWNVVARVDTPGEAPAVTPLPSATINAAPPNVLTTAEFVAALADGALNGQSVLVNGAVPELGYGTFCSPPPPLFNCALGVLAGTDPPIRVWYQREAATESEGAQFEGGDISWPWWDGPSWPVEGILVLTVDEDGKVRFMGRVPAADLGLTRSATEAAALDITDLDTYEIVLVDGWLTQVADYVECPAPNQGEPVVGLPNRFCGRSAFISDRPVQPAPMSSVSGIEVQPEAYYAFASSPSAQGAPIEPRLGTWALARRLEGWCGAFGMPPCWQWTVVARVDTGQSVAPTATPPAPSPVECADTRTRPVALFDDTGLVTGCRALGEVQIGELSSTPTVTNPDGDPFMLQIAWVADACVPSALAHLSGAAGAYAITIDQGEIVGGAWARPLHTDLSSTFWPRSTLPR